MSNGAPGQFQTQSLRNQALAIRADATEAEQDWLEVADSLDAAADEIDRLTDRSADDARDRERLRVDFNARAAEASRLHAVIENAPHDSECDQGWALGRLAKAPCTCWKADAL